LQINPSSYYYRLCNYEHIKLQNGGRPIPGYSYNVCGQKVCDEAIKEMIIQLIETEAFGYGYYKLTVWKAVWSYYRRQKSIPVVQRDGHLKTPKAKDNPTSQGYCK
jgi:hypothetical protein